MVWHIKEARFPKPNDSSESNVLAWVSDTTHIHAGVALEVYGQAVLPAASHLLLLSSATLATHYPGNVLLDRELTESLPSRYSERLRSKCEC